MTFWLPVIAYVAVLVMLAYTTAKPAWWRFKYDDRNPARRYCKTCGQQQVEMSRTWGGSTWWEECLPEPDPDCKCHLHSEYRI